MVYIFIERLLAKCKIWFSARLADSLESHCFATHHSKSLRSTCLNDAQHEALVTHFIAIFLHGLTLYGFSAASTFSHLHKNNSVHIPWLLSMDCIYFSFAFFDSNLPIAYNCDAHTIYLAWVESSSVRRLVARKVVRSAWLLHTQYTGIKVMRIYWIFLRLRLKTYMLLSAM